MILPHQSLHVLHLLFSSSPLHFTYMYVHIPNSGATLLLPPLLFDSLVIQPPLYSPPSPEAGVLRGFVPASPAVLATYSSRWGCPRSLHGWERGMKGGRRRRKCWALARQHRQHSACNILQEKTLLTTWSFALIESFIYTRDCRNKCLRLMIWLLFVHHLLQ